MFRYAQLNSGLKTHVLGFPPTSTLRPVILENTCTFCLTAAAGTEFAGAFSSDMVNADCVSSSEKRGLQPLEPSSPTRNRWIMLAHIVQDSRLLPSKRSLDRVSVPVWLATLSGQLRIFGLIGRYPTNNLILRKLIKERAMHTYGNPFIWIAKTLW